MTNWASVDRMLQDAVGAVFPSAQLVVIDGGAVVLERAVGAADADTVFDVASLTKPLATASLVMLKGIGLDETVRPGVTVFHLLSHSSGLPAWKLLGPDPVTAARAEPLAYPTGTRSIYSDLGFILLGDHVARRCGRSLAELFRDAIAAPLEIETTYAPAFDPSRIAPCEGLRGVVHDENARAMGGVAGHAGLFSTARDVAVIARALLAAWRGDGGLFPPDALRRFWSPANVPGSTWCLGWDRPSPGASQAGTRWPRSGVGHLGFTGCSLWLDPPRGRAVALLSNRVEPTRANERIKQLRPALHDAIVATLDGPAA